MRRLWGWGGIVFVLALSLRLVHAFQMSASPLFAMPAVDAATYSEQAASLAEGNWLGRGQGPFWQPPLYPYFLGVIKLVFSESFYYASRFAQALIGSLTCVLLYLVGQRLFGSGVGFIGGLIAAVYGPLIYFDARLLPAGSSHFFYPCKSLAVNARCRAADETHFYELRVLRWGWRRLLRRFSRL